MVWWKNTLCDHGDKKLSPMWECEILDFGRQTVQQKHTVYSSNFFVNACLNKQKVILQYKLSFLCCKSITINSAPMHKLSEASSALSLLTLTVLLPSTQSLANEFTPGQKSWSFQFKLDFKILIFYTEYMRGSSLLNWHVYSLQLK